MFFLWVVYDAGKELRTLVEVIAVTELYLFRIAENRTMIFENQLQSLWFTLSPPPRERDDWLITLYFWTVKILAQRPTDISAIATILLVIKHSEWNIREREGGRENIKKKKNRKKKRKKGKKEKTLK